VGGRGVSGNLSRKAIAKAVSWRISASLVTILLVLTFTGELRISLEVGLAEMIIKMFFYYLHEIFWERR